MEGIVIKSIDYKEKSKLIYLYTPEGMKSVKAIDANKTKLGFITTLNHVEFEHSAGKLPTVLEYSIKKSFYHLYADISKIQMIMPIIDVIQNIEEEAPHARIFSFVRETLDALETMDSPKFVLSIFLLKMLSVFGVRPALNDCVLCGNQTIVNFSIPQGGALCDKCSFYNEKAYALFQDFKELYYGKGFAVVSLNSSLDTILEQVYNYYLIHVNLRLKSYKI